jgi:hypothetical protein
MNVSNNGSSNSIKCEKLSRPREAKGKKGEERVWKVRW